jgi:hypothetical protein
MIMEIIHDKKWYNLPKNVVVISTNDSPFDKIVVLIREW